MLSPAPVIDRVYYSRFRDWDLRSAVRAKALPSFPERETAGRLFFTPELVPAAAHPLVLAQGDEMVHRLLAYHLLGHLDFTDALENEVVAPVAYMIGRGTLGLQLPADLRADARKIATDEMHHAFLTAGFVHDIAAASGVVPLPTRRPSFLIALDRIKASHDPAIMPLLMLFFCIVSETLITGTLTRVPKDERVVGGVRTILRDHAEDEARHHVYFAEMLARCWPQLAPSQRATIGALLPQFITLFLSPDILEIQAWLNRLGFTARDAEQLIGEAYAPTRTAAAIRSNAESTLRLMIKAGILDDPGTAESFHNADLI